MKKVVRKVLKKRGRPKKEEAKMDDKKKDVKPETPETPKAEVAAANVISDPNATIVKEDK